MNLEWEEPYAMCLELAGAKVLAYEAFGSYQGDWWAKCKLWGDVFWISGAYGSCSGCDQFEDEMGYDSHEHPGDKYVDSRSTDKWTPESCLECAAILKKAKSIGLEHLGGERYSQSEAEAAASEHSDWDMDAEKVVSWLKANAIRPQEG